LATFVYPNAVELNSIEPELMVRQMDARPIFTVFPTQNVNADVLLWEQKDNYKGLMQVRGLDGQPPRVIPVGAKRYRMEPGYYGEFSTVDEAEMTRRAAAASFAAYVDLGDLVRDRQDMLMGRQFDRMEQVLWSLLVTGTFSIPGPTGAVLHTDSYTTQTSTPAVTWATIATATPLADFRAVALLGRGKGVSFGDGSVAYMNQATFNDLVRNTNAADLGGRRTTGLQTINNQAGVNQILTGDNLPRVVVYDQGYLNDAGTFTLFIPNNKVVVVGQRPGGVALGEFRFTRNLNNRQTGVGPYTVVDDQPDRVPRQVIVHRGFNGGPVLYWPSAVVVMTV
jgi:hypothetical protein